MTFRIGLDTSALQAGFKDHAMRGIGRYVSNLERALKNLRQDQIELATFTQDQLLGHKLNFCANLLPRARTIFRQQVLLPLRLRFGSELPFDALHFPAHMDVPIVNSQDFIVTVLDLIPLIFRDLYRPARLPVRYDLARWIERKAIQNATLVICISECTASDVERLLHVPRERIAVTPLGVDQKFLEERKGAVNRAQLFGEFGLDPGLPHLLYVGGIDQRKNVGFMLEVLAELKCHYRTAGKPVPRLIMAGAIDTDRQYPGLLAQIRRLDLQHECVMLGFVSDEKLSQLYAAADLFFFPSLYEGFGLTPLEAMACGAAVASSNASSMPEVLGDAALYFDPRSVEQGARAVISVLDNENLCKEFGRKGRERAKLFSWERTAQLTISAYKQLASKYH